MLKARVSEAESFESKCGGKFGVSRMQRSWWEGEEVGYAKEDFGGEGEDRCALCGRGGRRGTRMMPIDDRRGKSAGSGGGGKVHSRRC